MILREQLNPANEEVLSTLAALIVSFDATRSRCCGHSDAPPDFQWLEHCEREKEQFPSREPLRSSIQDRN
jgi:hypothetical protein